MFLKLKNSNPFFLYEENNLFAEQNLNTTPVNKILKSIDLYQSSIENKFYKN
jgi:hypothetical protein